MKKVTSNNVSNVLKMLVPSKAVNDHIIFILEQKKKNTIVAGFNIGNAPLAYIKEIFKEGIKNNLYNIFFKAYFRRNIINKYNKSGTTLFFNINAMINIDVEKNKLEFFHTVTQLKIFENKKNVSKKLKLVKRKLYKDLDKQATQIVDNELNQKNIYKSAEIDYGDWIKISVDLLDDSNKIISANTKLKLWIEIRKEEIFDDIHAFFSKKHKGDVILSNAKFIQDFLNQNNFIKYNFKITVLEHVSCRYFDFSIFAKYFKCDTKKQLYEKIIEGFSFKKDISMYKMIGQSIFKKLFKIYNPIITDKILNEYLIEIQETITKNPDYLIYQSKKTFMENVRRFAHEQLSEIAIIDYLSAKEKIKVITKDIILYLNMLQRNRLKEFLYFDRHYLKSLKTCIIPDEILEKMVLREKTLDTVTAKMIKNSK
jgi:hypothetical protein